jgi:deoxyadenosine/deoxycytidine kinase
MYENPKRYAFLFQNYVLLTRLKQYNESLSSPFNFHIFERSLFSDKEIFIKNLYKNKLLEDSEYEVYKLMNNLGFGPKIN